jgi:hypothetical protein
MSLKSACFIVGSYFLVKKQNFQTCDYSYQMLDDQDFQIIKHLVNGIFL